MTDQDYMQMAIQAAKLGQGKTYRNPLVGAVIVKNQQVLAVGHHLSYGKAHAEVNAYQQVKHPEELHNSTLYVTLEPCCHTGKTPPCAKQIVQWGVSRVVIGAIDPNPLVNGKGIAYLKVHGVAVTTGVVEKQAKQLNPSYNFFYTKHRPMVTIKVAQSLDGKIALPGQQRTLLTDQVANEDVDRVRAIQQAILIGSNTALLDNPQLLVKYKTLPYPPIRIILDRRGRLDDTCKILQSDQAPVWIFTINPALQQRLSTTAAKIILGPSWKPVQVVDYLAAQGVQSVLVEGGAQIQAAFLSARLVDQLIIYQISALFGGQSLAAFSGSTSAEQVEYHLQKTEHIGNALKITARRVTNNVYRPY